MLPSEEPFHLIEHRISRRHFLQAGGLATIGAVAMRDVAWAQRPRERTLFIGTYTSSTSEGIYVYRMNSETGQLTKFSSISSENPSFLTLDRSRRFLYAVNELAEF
jgi:6-phosphogluconolactonase